MALDRSLRSYDEDGRLHVAATPITAARVNPYYGWEVPNAAELGLDPQRLYQVLRPPEELARAAGTFNNLPLLSAHAAAHADDHRPGLVIGSTGTDAAFDAPYVKVSLVIWSSEGIEGVTSGLQREISAAYRYRAVAERGTYQGAAYELRMAEIRGSHCALVATGRVGPDVLVADSAPQPKGSTMKASTPGLSRDDETELDDSVASQLKSYLGELLTSEQMADIETILAGGTVAAPSMAGDAAARRVARRVVADQRTRQEQDYLRRFPEARRLAR